MFKIRRYARYDRLKQNGFLPFESRPLSSVPVATCPYLKAMIRERRDEYKRAWRAGIKQKQYEADIKARYNNNGWLKRNKAGKMVADPWRMLRDFEDQFKDKNPGYESPWVPRRRAWKDFLTRIERHISESRGLPPRRRDYLQPE